MCCCEFHAAVMQTFPLIPVNTRSSLAAATGYVIDVEQQDVCHRRMGGCYFHLMSLLVVTSFRLITHETYFLKLHIFCLCHLDLFHYTFAHSPSVADSLQVDWRSTCSNRPLCWTQTPQYYSNCLMYFFSICCLCKVIRNCDAVHCWKFLLGLLESV